jgi:hypothetical protein
MNHILWSDESHVSTAPESNDGKLYITTGVAEIANPLI